MGKDQTMNTEIDERRAALAAHLELDVDEVEEANYGENTFSANGGEYLVLTDSEADDAAKEDIEQSLWAFRPEFLADFTDLPVEIFTALQDKCEGANDTVRTLIERADGIDDFVDQAVSADGRGHFISHYDGEENEQGDWFIYRVN